MSTLPAITLTHQDHARLSAVVAAATARDQVLADALDAELARARLVTPEQLPPSVVTMESRVRVQDDRGDVHEYTLVYPGRADASTGRISVLAPIGAALIGLATGQSIEWLMPDGRMRTLRVLAVTRHADADAP